MGASIRARLGAGGTLLCVALLALLRGSAAHVGSDHNVTDPGIESVTWTEAAALGRNGEEAYVELHVGDSLVFLGDGTPSNIYLMASDEALTKCDFTGATWLVNLTADTTSYETPLYTTIGNYFYASRWPASGGNGTECNVGVRAHANVHVHNLTLSLTSPPSGNPANAVSMALQIVLGLLALACVAVV